MGELINKQDISAGYRAIRDGSRYDKYFTRAEDVDRVIIENGEVEQTVDLMKKVVWRYLGDTMKIAPLLKGKTLDSTCGNVWSLLHDHIQYRLDKKGLEQLRRPCRSWEERTGGIDCDCFSIFVSSILTNLGIPHKFRITKYNQDVYQHVYVIVPQKESEYITIDCVLSGFDEEKPYSQKKDFTMNMNGINVAVLSGIDGDVMDLISGLEGIEELTGVENEQKLYEHLVKTRVMIAANPSLVSNVDYPPAFIKMLDYALENWHTPNRAKALEILAKNEDALNRLNGFEGIDDFEGVYDTELDGFDGLDELYGDFDELGGKRKKNAKKKGKRGFFKKIGQAITRGGKLFVRFNPLTISARNGFLLAMKLNIKQMAKKLKWAYATREQATAKGVSVSDWEKSKNALAKIEKLFADKLQGKKSALRNAILKGRAGGINGVIDESAFDGLGIVPAVALTAAIPVIALAVKALVESGLMKKSEEENVEQDVNAQSGDAASMANDPDMKEDGNSDPGGGNSDNSDPDQSSDVGDSSGADAGSGGIIGFIKKQPLLVIGGAALGILGITVLLRRKKPQGKGMSGTGGSKSHKKRKKGKVAGESGKNPRAITLR